MFKLILTSATAVFASLGLIAAVAQPAVPDTPAGHAMNGWLSAFDRGDKDTYRRFMQTAYPSHSEKDIDDVMMFREETGGFDLRKIVDSTPTKLVALVQEHLSDQFARLTVAVEGNEPHHIKSMDLMAVPRPVEYPIPHLSEAQLATSLKQSVEQKAAAGRFDGAVLVAKNGTPVFEQAYGFADRARKIPNTLTTKFRIGSMNKMFTAVSVLQLVQAGKIGLDTPFGTYLPDYPNKEMASKVTIAQLLTHTGGTGDIFGPEFTAHRLQLKTLDDYINLYGKRPLRFPPGSRFDYSNYGFILLGAVIEKVSGESYYDYVREHVYAPADMTSTGSEPEDIAVADRSIGYTETAPGRWEPNTDTLPYRGTSAGGGYSTVVDLLRFANALEQHRLLNAHYTELLTTGKVATPGGGHYAYGFGDRVMNGTRCFGHNGGAPGMSGDLEICPDSGYVVAVLANVDPPAAHVSEFITNRLPQTGSHS